MSKFLARAIETLMVGAMTTAIAQAQTIAQTGPLPTPSVTIPVNSPQPAPTPDPSADPDDTPTPTPYWTATPSTQPTPPRSKIEWNGGRGAEYFIAGDYLFGGNNRNEFNPYGVNGQDSFAGRAAVEYPVGKIAVMAEGTYDHWQYTTQAGFVPVIGNNGHTFVPSFYAHNTDWDGRIGIGLQHPRVFAVASYGQRQNNFGYPTLQGFGFGIEKLPDFDHKYWSFFGSYLYYPQFGSGNNLQYGFYKYQAGLDFYLNSKHVPAFLEVGYMGDYGYSKLNAPASISDNGIFAGLGFHF